MKIHSPTKYICDFCNKQATDPPTIGSGGYVWGHNRKNWAKIIETVETGCPAENIPLEEETREYDICNDCLSELSKSAIARRHP